MSLLDFAAIAGAALIVAGVALVAGIGVACVTAGVLLIVGAKAAA